MHDCPHGKIYGMEHCPECEAQVAAGTLAEITRMNTDERRRMERNILKDAAEIINDDRPAKYGRVEESYEKVAQVANLIFDEGEASTEGFTAEKALKVMIAVKLVRDSYSPGNPGHLRDAAGYIGLLDQVRQRRKEPGHA